MILRACFFFCLGGGGGGGGGGGEQCSVPAMCITTPTNLYM